MTAETPATGISRRTVAKGAAWSIPVIAATAAAPAVAASTACKPTLSWSGGANYNWGVFDSGSGTTTQSLNLGGQTYVNNLPKGVTVTSVTYDFWFENRVGQQSPGPGVFFPGNNTSNVKGYCSTANGTCTGIPAASDRSPGFAATWGSTANLKQTTFKDGRTLPAWNAHLTFDGTAPGAGAYTPKASGCDDFTTGPSGRSEITYTGVTRSQNCKERSINTLYNVKAVLSDGTVLTLSVPGNSLNIPNCP